MKISTNKIKIKETLFLESGRVLEDIELIYETYGTLNKLKSNVILVTHGLSASHHAAGYYENDRKPGWWDDLIGAEKLLDSNKYFIICISNIGSCYGSTSPLSINPETKKEYRLNFPVLTISDIVNAQKMLFKKLEIEKVKIIIGGSMGGMQALCYAIEHPYFAEKIIAISTTGYTRPLAIALNKIGIESIRKDKDFEDGYYDKEKIKEKGLVGLSIARMVGHISYLTNDSMEEKFGRRYLEKDGLYELFGNFEVERYLEYNGEKFSREFDPLSYIYILKTLSIFNISRNQESIEDTLKKIKAKLYLISFSGDLLFKSEEMKEIEEIMIGNGQKDLVEYKEIDSSYGHDSFLVEAKKLSTILKNIVD